MCGNAAAEKMLVKWGLQSLHKWEQIKGKLL